MPHDNHLLLDIGARLPSSDNIPMLKHQDSDLTPSDISMTGKAIFKTIIKHCYSTYYDCLMTV